MLRVELESDGGRPPLDGLSSSQRIAAASEMADQIAVIVAAVERGEIGASVSEVAQLHGALVALRTISE